MKIAFFLPRFPLEEHWDKLKKTIESYPLCSRICPLYETYCKPLFGRVFGNWRESVMIAGVVFSVIGLAAAFFSGSLFYCICCGAATLVSLYGAYYMRTQAPLHELEDAVESLKQTKEKFEHIASDLHRENLVLQITNRELIKTNESLKETNEQLLLTNEKLREQVVELAIISKNLKESAQEIRNEVAGFRTHNVHFDACLKNLEYQLSTSQAFYEETAHFLRQEKKGFAEKLQELTSLLQEIKAQKPTLDKIKELSHVHEQLSQLKGEYALERGKLEEVRRLFQDEHKKLQEIRAAFSVEQQKLELLRKAFEELLSKTPRMTAPPSHIPFPSHPFHFGGRFVPVKM